MNLSVIFRESLPRWVADELDHQFSVLAASWEVEHKSDNTHGDIICDSIALRTGPVVGGTATGAISGTGKILADLTIETTGAIHSGATSFTAGTGYWLAYNSGSPQFRVGNPAGSRLAWDGAELDVYGSGYTLTDDGGLYFYRPGSQSDNPRMIRWEDGAKIAANNARMWILGPPSGGVWSQENLYHDYIAFYVATSGGGGDSVIEIDATTLMPGQVGSGVVSLGVPGTHEFNGLAIDDWFYWDGPSSTNYGDYPVVWSSGDKYVRYKDDGADATLAVLGSDGITVYTLTFEKGICTYAGV